MSETDQTAERDQTGEPTEPAPQTNESWSPDAVDAVESAVLGVPGVAELYRAKPTLQSAVAAVQRISARGEPPRVVVDGDVLRVVIATDGFAPAPQVARAVHDAALAAAEAAGHALSRVDVRVARVG
ncbi:hypothetical protein [Curtobacterium sp. MCBA15_001]|uniref:hypothetical protein n=1 Tax=Curtobacterium sp. MCBA15_001 TaxID=1898731 RepID=UPI0008DD93BE|nr:hypothetical protein [Curtobacterium sp. MCBA15_001]OIH94524.1 hypothetical protein BIU90_05265 [Curtobacterium sp. MCBA15_001]